jgi:ABC-type Zn uptake system ZnuABC Zn-binding protein ZnuA
MRITGHGRVISLLLVLVAFTIVLGLVVGALTIWPGRRSSPQPQGPPLVMASIFPLASLCSEIGGDAITVTTLMPTGANPHTYEMTPRDAKSLAGAQLIIQVGAGLDPFVARLATAGAESVRIVETISALPTEWLLAEDQDHVAAGGGATGIDPHFWTDPVLVRDHIVPALGAELASAWPEHAAGFAERAATLRDRLTELDIWIASQAPDLRTKGLITMHPAWAYFGRRYGIDTWAVEEHAGNEPSPLWIAELIEIARFRGIGTLFTEPQLSPQVAAAIERELRVQVMVLDPIGGADRPGYHSYVEMMRTNVETMVRGLR